MDEVAKISQRDRLWIAEHMLSDLGKVVTYGMSWAAATDAVLGKGYSDSFRRALEDLVSDETGVELILEEQATSEIERERYRSYVQQLKETLDRGRRISYRERG